MDLRDNRVAVSFLDKADYPRKPPYDPPERYPELKASTVDKENSVYPGVRYILFRLGLDKENFGSPGWNPFKEIIQPGMTVFIKPNTVAHVHGNKKDIFSVINHGSVLRPIIDYVCIALNGRGKITIADSPLIMSYFDKAMEVSGIKALVEHYRTKTAIPIECFDLRITRAARSWLYGRWERKPINQDRNGYRFVDLGAASCFDGIDPNRLRIAVANYKNMVKHHSNGKHEYLFPQSFLNSDVVISIAKLKTHRRTGVTLCLKNFMGLPAWKDTLPHFIVGSPSEGGDQYIHPSRTKSVCTGLHDRIQSSRSIPVKFGCAVAKKIIWNSGKVLCFKDDIYEAMWHGNDTLWRTLLDLNRAALYADKMGRLTPVQQRGVFCLIDGIVGGESDGPLSPDPVYSGVLMAGFNPVTLDVVGATLMGFDVEKIPLIRKATEALDGGFPLFFDKKEAIRVIEKDGIFNLSEFKKKRNLNYKAHPNWKGIIELERQTD